MRKAKAVKGGKIPFLQGNRWGDKGRGSENLATIGPCFSKEERMTAARKESIARKGEEEKRGLTILPSSPSSSPSPFLPICNGCQQKKEPSSAAYILPFNSCLSLSLASGWSHFSTFPLHILRHLPLSLLLSRAHISKAQKAAPRNGGEKIKCPLSFSPSTVTRGKEGEGALLGTLYLSPSSPKSRERKSFPSSFSAIPPIENCLSAPPLRFWHLLDPFPHLQKLKVHLFCGVHLFLPDRAVL